jgi:transposase
VDTSRFGTEEFTMSDRSVRYTPEFKRQMVELVRAGRTPGSLAKEFGPTAWTISTWAKQDARDAGKGDGGLTSAEREELAKLRRENRRLKEEREILSKAAAWLCVQKRWTRSAGDSPAGEIVRTP